MSFIGTGGEDWVELDLDLFERSRLGRLLSLVTDGRGDLAAAVGAEFDVEDEEGEVFLTVAGRRRYQVELASDDRLVLTWIPHPDGPL